VTYRFVVATASARQKQITMPGDFARRSHPNTGCPDNRLKRSPSVLLVMQIVTAKRPHLGLLGPQKGLFSVVTCSQPDWPNHGAQDPLPLEPQFASGRVPGVGRAVFGVSNGRSSRSRLELSGTTTVATGQRSTRRCPTAGWLSHGLPRNPKCSWCVLAAK